LITGSFLGITLLLAGHGCGFGAWVAFQVVGLGREPVGFVSLSMGNVVHVCGCGSPESAALETPELRPGRGGSTASRKRRPVALVLDDPPYTAVGLQTLARTTHGIGSGPWWVVLTVLHGTRDRAPRLRVVPRRCGLPGPVRSVRRDRGSRSRFQGMRSMTHLPTA